MRPKTLIAKSPEYLFYAVLFLLPLQTRWIFKAGELNGGYWEYGTMSLYGTDILLVVLVTWVIGRRFFQRELRIKNYELPARPPAALQQLRARNATQSVAGGRITKLWACIGLLEFTIFISIFFAHDWRLALYGYGVFLLGVGLFFVATTLRYDASKVYASIALAGAVQSALAIWQAATQTVYGNKWLGMASQHVADLGVSVVGSDADRWLRAYGSMPHPNMFGGFLALCALVSVVLCFQVKRRYQVVSIILFMLNFTGLLLTFSRAAWLAFAVGFAVLAVGYIGKAKDNVSRIVTCAFVVVTISSLFFWQFGSQVSGRLRADSRLESISIEERLHYHSEAWQVIKAHPLVGVGLGNYGVAVHKEVDNTKAAYAYQPVHNVFLLIWAEVGMFGVICFLVFLFSCFALLWRKKHVAALALLAALIVIALFDHWLWSLHFGVLLFWGILGLILKKEDFVK